LLYLIQIHLQAGLTPLLTAAKLGESALVQSLIEAKADQAATAQGKTYSEYLGQALSEREAQRQKQIAAAQEAQRQAEHLAKLLAAVSAPTRRSGHSSGGCGVSACGGCSGGCGC
jgi:hypothetical protein